MSTRTLDAHRRRRRQWLTGAVSASALTLFPWLGNTRAQGNAVPRKLLLFYTPHGTVYDRWQPGGGETDFTFSPILQPLSEHRDHLVIVDGLRMDNGTEYYIPHTYTMPALWTGSPIDTADNRFCRDDHGQCFGWNTGTSVDQFLASELGLNTPFPTLELGYGCGALHPANRMIYSSAGNPKSPLDDPETAFEALFAEIDEEPEAEPSVDLRAKSVLDTVLEDFKHHRQRLSAADKQRLDAHAERLRELEMSQQLMPAMCERPTRPSDVNAETAIDRQSALMAAALGCGLTQIASFQLRRGDNDDTLYPWVGVEQDGHHTLSHDSGDASQAKLAELYTWYSGRFAYLLDRLAQTPDVDGTSVLDNTLVIWGSELGRGWDHSLANVPFILAGGANSRLRAGRYLQVSDTLTNRVLVTACHSMGLSEVEQYGTTDTGVGPLDVLTAS
jgi:hypothetical protein